MGRFSPFYLCKLFISKLFIFSIVKSVYNMKLKKLYNGNDKDENDSIVQIIKTKAPLVTYTLLDEYTLLMDLEIDGKQMSHTFRLGEEHVMKKNDGGTVKMTYTVEGNSVIKQVIKMPDGKTAYFRREFNDNEIKMIVTMDGTDLSGTIYYELVQ